MNFLQNICCFFLKKKKKSFHFHNDDGNNVILHLFFRWFAVNLLNNLQAIVSQSISQSVIRPIIQLISQSFFSQSFFESLSLLKSVGQSISRAVDESVSQPMIQSHYVGSNAVSPPFHYRLSSVHYCKDRSRIHFVSFCLKNRLKIQSLSQQQRPL